MFPWEASMQGGCWHFKVSVDDFLFSSVNDEVQGEWGMTSLRDLSQGDP